MESALAAIRPPLQSITHNLPKPVQDLALSLLGPECYTHLVLDINPSDVECLKLAISKALGTAIVGVSGIVKIPQLLKLLQSGSAQGVSFVSYALETAAYLITLAYNARQGNPFSTYGENALISAQNVAIAALVLTYQGQGAGAISYIAGLAGMVYALFNESLVDGKMMSMLQAGAGVLGVASKVPQIVTIWQEGSTGQLSAFAVFNFLFGSIARIFTTMQEVNDPVILYGYLAGFALNLVLAVQVLYYWNTPTKPARPTKGRANKMPKPAIQVESDKGQVSTVSGAEAAPRQLRTRRRA